MCNAFLLPTAPHCSRGLWGSVLSTLPPKLCARPITPPRAFAASQASNGGPASLIANIHWSATTLGQNERTAHHPNHHPFIQIRPRCKDFWLLGFGARRLPPKWLHIPSSESDCERITLALGLWHDCLPTSRQLDLEPCLRKPKGWDNTVPMGFPNLASDCSLLSQGAFSFLLYSCSSR